MNQVNPRLQTNFSRLLPLTLLFLVPPGSGAGEPATPPPPSVVLEDFRLTGDLGSNRAAFTLTAAARVENREGGSLELLSGAVALTEVGPHPKWHLRAGQNCFAIAFDHAGRFPIALKFDATVQQTGNWNAVEFRVAPSALQPIVLHGLAADTQFEFGGAARPERIGNDFVSYLPSGGAVKLAWKEARPEVEGKLFYAVEMLSQISLGPGLMRQAGLLNFKVMQGELKRVALLLRGTGEVTRVQGDAVLAWNVEPASGSAERRLVVQLNQPQKDAFALQVQVQTPLGAFPQTTEAVQLRPEGATRFAGYCRIVNEGAVRLEVAQATGLSQISPEQFPETDVTRALLRPSGNQRFVYRFSGADFGLRIQADQILPELAVSQLLAYHLGENELAIDAEIELDIREAPLRELLVRVPKGYAIAQLVAPGLSDYFLREPPDQPQAELRLVYSQPISGRQVAQLRLERNQALEGSAWELPRLEVAKAKSVRGHIAVAADPGFRLTPERTQGLTEIATAFFPRQLPGIQAAFRLSDPAWQAAVRVERLPQTVQADVFHLFSVGEGIAYGSSLMNYVVSGAPVAAFKVELSDEYFNVEFTGKDLRNWQKTAGGYLVQLHTPAAGAYTLLATYERPFKSQGETLTFTGARPLDAQSEQGYTLIISAYQFEVKPELVSRGLLRLDTREVPPEYRLFFDAPILAAFRYTARPFDLKLALSPLAQGDSLSLVVDRAALTNRISKEGQVLTDARYFVKNRGNPNLKLALPAGTQLWSASVNGSPVVPVLDGEANLIPLPQHASPDAVLVIDLKLAAKTKVQERVVVSAPVVGAPVLLAEWRVEPDSGQRLIYRGGSLTPAGGAEDLSGFSALARLFTGPNGGALGGLCAVLGLLAASLAAWRWASSRGVYRFSPRHICGMVFGLAALVLATAAFLNFVELPGLEPRSLPRELSFVAPVQQAGSALSLEVGNVADRVSAREVLGYGWPALLAAALWTYAWLAATPGGKVLGRIGGWLLLAWAALRWPNGATAFLAVVAGFLVLHAVIPAARRLFRLPPPPQAARAAAAQGGPAPATALLLLAGMVWWGCICGAHAAEERHAASSARIFHGCRQPEGVAQTSSLPYRGFPIRRSSVHPERQNRRAVCRLEVGDTAGWKPALRSLGSPAPTLGRGVSELAPPRQPPVPESVTQELRVEDRFALGAARIRWEAEKGDRLPLLFEPAVLMRLNYPTNALKLEPGPAGAKLSHCLVARQRGAFEVEVQYQLQTARRGQASGVVLPVPYGLVNRLKLTVVNLDVDVLSPQEVALERELTGAPASAGSSPWRSPQAVALEHEAAGAPASAGSNTVASLVLAPASETWIGWQPRRRDVKREKPVFYAELTQLYVPMAGVIEGAHFISIRPAQGELTELVLDVPAGATITDVLDPARLDAKGPGGGGSVVSLWRFDPDARKLRVTLNPGQSRPFALLARSQIAAGPLPFTHSFGLLTVENAGGQIGLLGVAAGNEVQLDSVTAEGFSPINLEDFPPEPGAALQAQIPGLAVRRAFRYEGRDPLPAPTPTPNLNPNLNLTPNPNLAANAAPVRGPLRVQVKASAVEPDIRVETQDTLSLGEDRTVLADNASVDITRAGIFRLSFLMPPGFDVESISGQALSHWTESRTEAGRVMTLHLTGKTEGQQQLAISLVGPGIKEAKAWPVPRLVLREAGKQRGTLLLVPEQGFRLQAGASEGVTQLDPQRSGIREKGVLAFRVLQRPWSLALDIERVDPWIQVTSLQHATVTDAQVKVVANLQYQIENTGLKAFRVFLPTNAESVRFQGEQVADFIPAAGALTNGLRAWDIKLHRRVIGPYLLQATYQTFLPEQGAETLLRGVQAGGVNLQRGFVTVQSGGRLQVRIQTPPAALQPAEWQSIPRVLLQDLPAAAASYSYRLVEPSFELPLKLERHEAAKILEARVNRVTFTSIISDEGVMLTHARLELQPGDKRLLNVALPRDAHFWFAFVNQGAVWPWRGPRGVLIPLEPPPRGDQAIPVELFYSSRVGVAGARAFELDLVAPKFDLPLENITWRVSLSDKWRVRHWSGSLQLQEAELLSQTEALDLPGYLRNEDLDRLERTRHAEDLLTAGNTALEQGDPQQARRAFQAAYGLSSHDAAFNEDARVQLHNIKLQQALIGLNVRQAATTGDAAALGPKFRGGHGGKEVNYTQQDAKAIIDRNTADDNAAFMRLAERLIQQQDAAVSAPAALRVSIPQQGRVLTFKRAVAVDPGADLNLRLRAVPSQPASPWTRALILGGTLLLMSLTRASRWS
ncbi:MAG TPA: hypothetical protein VN829_11485 [Dongiaceae bacterium]|nr:hypothetical protein [Dongiaceae bacterium]